ncbi:MAG: zinc ABC transporter substrate-binding protein [Leptospiraceae bacterium]|nr:zinc ABC transporter substrate-binding protein [Leptospiraceae bacterium]MCP5511361.1 zinc ABC transporter substrate-binding protein [Leptospiraceae bacterium]
MNTKLTLYLTISFFLTIFPIFGEKKLQVVTTTTNLKYFVEQIGKERVEVFSMIRGYDDPHFVMTRPDFLVKLNKADLFCQIGLDLEIGWIPLLLQQSRNYSIQKGQNGFCDTSVGIKVLGEPTVNVDRSMGDMHIYGNPHYWLDPINAIQMATTISQALIRIDPVSSDFYKANLDIFKKRLIDLTKNEMKKFTPYIHSRVAVFHDQFVYLANRFKFTANLTIEERPGVPPSNAYMEKVIATMISQKIQVILISPYHNKKYADFVSSKVPGSKVIVLPETIGATPDIQTYEESIEKMMEMISNALSETKSK